MKHIKEIQDKLNKYIPEEILFRIIFEMFKYFDKDFTNEIQLYQKNNKVVFNTSERRMVRRYYYYNNEKCIENLNIKAFPTICMSDEEKTDVVMQCINRLSIYDEDKILNSIIKRYENLISGSFADDNMELWLDYYNKKRKEESLYSLAIISIDQKAYENNNYNFSFIYKKIRKAYSQLENYRHLVLVFNGELRDKKGNFLTWKEIYKTGIYCENFMQYKQKFFPFKKEQQINELSEFIKNRTHFDRSLDLARQFYSSISYGFKFEDLYISDNLSKKFLVFKKINLDKRNVPCPSCMTTIQSSNSYPEMFLQAWECKNEDCQDRSKSGRGKRFEEFGTYRYFKMVEDDPRNRINADLYKKWKRDIFESDSDIFDMILNYYCWAGETVAYDGNAIEIKNCNGRELISFNFDTLTDPIDSIELYSSLPIVSLMKSINKKMTTEVGTKQLNGKIVAIHGNSTKFLQSLRGGLIGSAITSPPYYNAREYSQWPTLILYLIDMMANAKTIYNSLDEKGTYLYNIGDIVSEDNVYVRSNMSKKRLQLGFLSCMIFEIVGFSLNGNKIWDKGEVQSKRNSTTNLNTGYIKCINCYEHVFVFQKENSIINNDSIEKFSPVIKINSKGENKYGHTAPFPLDMVELIKPYVLNDKYILDPFLGSGTTLVWCKKNNKKGLGIELNDEYYKLCVEKLDSK